MLHTKFRGNRLNESGEEFGKIFTLYGLIGHFGLVTIIFQNFHFHEHKSLHTKFG